MTSIFTKFRFGSLLKAKAKAKGKEHTIIGLRPKLRRDCKRENEIKNFGIFNGFLLFNTTRHNALLCSGTFVCAMP